jgi:holin (3TMs family)
MPFGVGLDDVVSGLVSSTVGPLFTRLIDLIPDPAEKARQAALIQEKLMAADAAMIAAQNAVNLAEATNTNMFVSGWRPAVGWVCVSALGWQVVVAPFIGFGAAFFGYHPVLPVLDSSWFGSLMIPMLGLGAMKTAERISGVSNEGQKPTKTLMVRPSQSVLDLPSAGSGVG